MTQFYSRSDMVFNGDVYSIPFSYTEKNEINVYIDDVIFSNWLFLNDSQIQLTSIPEGVTSESVVSIRRTTDITKPIVEYSNNTMLTKEALNSSQNQLLNAIQEVYDNNEEFKIETNNNLITNKQEILNIQSDFKDEVNTKIQQVSDAAAKINQLEDAVNTAVTSANTATEKANIAGAEVEKAKAEVEKVTETVQNSLTNIESKTLEGINKIKQTGFYMEGDKLYYIDSNGETKEFKSTGSSAKIGDIGFAPYVDETTNERRRLNGQVLIKDQYPAFVTWLTSLQATTPSLFATEDEWQAIKTASKLGQCGKFVIGDTTIRLPQLVNINGLVDMSNAGLIKDESLPNVKGTIDNVFMIPYETSTQTGAFKKSVRTPSTNSGISAGSETAYGNVVFNTSDSSSTYQDGAVVQQEAIQYPFYITVNTGSETTKPTINDYTVTTANQYGMSQYYKGVMNSGAWLRSNGQMNPKATYEGLYNWALAQLNAGVEGFKSSTASDITDYDFVINQTDETFRLPLKNGMEGVFASGIVPSDYNLYYYCGNVEENHQRVNVARIEEALVNKLDTPPRYVVEVSDKSLLPSWYEIYNDGWCRQGGDYNGSATTGTITLLKEYKDVESYSIMTQVHFDNSGYGYQIGVFNKSINSFKWGSAGSNYKFNWQASGYIR